MTIKTLDPSPFKHMCMTIGGLPSSYMESMTYYEALTYLMNYLEKEVVPVVNNNSEVVKELKSFVEHYFDNLDVQEEINNKLDDMAESGQLTDIIAQYLQLAGVLSFNTVADLVSAENIVDGSTAKTLGKLSYADGLGSFYKIRSLTSSDVIDGDKLIALNVSNTLVAEKIVNYELELAGLTKNTTSLAHMFNANIYGNVQGSCCDEDGHLYIYDCNNDSQPEIKVYDLANNNKLLRTIAIQSFTTTTEHGGNDMTYLNGKIYCLREGFQHSSIMVYDIASGSETTIYPPLDLTVVDHISSLAAVDNDHMYLMCDKTNTSIKSIDQLKLYMYTLSTNSVVEVPILNNNHVISNNLSTAGGIEYMNGYIFMVVNGDCGVIVFKKTVNGFELVANQSVDQFDRYGFSSGEFESITRLPATIYGAGSMAIITRTNGKADDTLGKKYITTGYLFNPFFVETRDLKSYWHPSVGTGHTSDIVYLEVGTDDINYEDGTTAYPFKSTERAIACLTRGTMTFYSKIVCNNGGTFGLPSMGGATTQIRIEGGSSAVKNTFILKCGDHINVSNVKLVLKFLTIDTGLIYMDYSEIYCREVNVNNNGTYATPQEGVFVCYGSRLHLGNTTINCNSHTPYGVVLNNHSEGQLNATVTNNTGTKIYSVAGSSMLLCHTSATVNIQGSSIVLTNGLNP